jgi:hypothetical protein
MIKAVTTTIRDFYLALVRQLTSAENLLAHEYHVSWKTVTGNQVLNTL